MCLIGTACLLPVLFQPASTIKIQMQLSLLVWYKVNIFIISVLTTTRLENCSLSIRKRSLNHSSPKAMVLWPHKTLPINYYHSITHLPRQGSCVHIKPFQFIFVYNLRIIAFNYIFLSFLLPLDMVLSKQQLITFTLISLIM